MFYIIDIGMNEDAENKNTVAKSFNVSMHFKPFKGCLDSFIVCHSLLNTKMIDIHVFSITCIIYSNKSRGNVPLFNPVSARSCLTLPCLNDPYSNLIYLSPP